MTHRSTRWMTGEDVRIPEYVDEGWGAPGHIASECFEQVSPAHVRERLELLAEAGLAVPIWSDGWALTR